MPPSRLRKLKSVVSSTYEVTIGDRKVPIWTVLEASNYRSPHADNFSKFDAGSWGRMNRQTRYNMRRHAEKFLESRENCRRVLQHLDSSPSAESFHERNNADEPDVHISEDPSSLSQLCINDASEIQPQPAAVEGDGEVGASISHAVSASDQHAEVDVTHGAALGPASDPASGNRCGSDFKDTTSESNEHHSNFKTVQSQQTGCGLFPTVEKRRLKFSELWNSFSIKHDISHTASDELILDVRREKPIMDLHTVPLHFKNRVKIPRQRDNGSSVVGLRYEDNGQCYHFGLYKHIRRYLQRVMDATFAAAGVSSRPTVPCVCIDAWVDGTQVAESGTNIHLWPLAARFIAIGQWDDDPSRRHFVAVPAKLAFMPFPVAVFLGDGKPEHCDALLRRFVYELKYLDPRPRTDRDDFTRKGRIWLERRSNFTVNLLWLLADTPARALVKHVRSWNLSGDGGCEACTAEGSKFTANMCTSRFNMTEEGVELRVDEKFQEYHSHRNPKHNLPSPLEDLKYFGMVSCVPPDEMHTMYQLIWKRINALVIALDVKPAKMAVKIYEDFFDGSHTVRKLVEIESRVAILDSRLLLVADHFTPCEFARTLSASRDMSGWKCTQDRQFGLYCGYGIFEGLVSERCSTMVRYLKVFNMLIIGMQGECPSSHDLDLAQECIEYVVSEFMKLLKIHEGKRDPNYVPSIPYCIHLALHIVGYVRRLGVSYAKLSAFGYENFIGDLVPEVRSTNCMIDQIVNQQKRRDLFVLNRDSNGCIARGMDGEPLFGWGGWKGHSKIQNQDDPAYHFTPGKKFSVLDLHRFSVGTNFSDSWVLVSATPGIQLNPMRLNIFQCVDFVDGSDSDVGDADVHWSDTSFAVHGEQNRISLLGHFYPEKSDHYKEPYPSSAKYEYVFENCRNPSLVQVPVEAVVAKLYVFPRFLLFGEQTSPRSISRDDLGECFEHVRQWIAIALRH